MMATPRRPLAFLSALAATSLVMTGCNALRLPGVGPEPAAKVPPPPIPAARGEFRVSQFVFIPDFDLNSNLPIFRELGGLREQVFKDLQLPPSDTPIYVHLFEDRERYERYMQAKHPDLPRRRAFFIAQQTAIGGGEKLMVFTYWGDRIQQDLRHELTHALLHSVLKDVPLWLDEGLAEYYEMAPGWKGVNYDHLAQLRSGAMQLDLARLEKLSKVEQMAPAEYREAWAWVHLMMHGKPEGRRVLLSYLKELRTNPTPGPLRPRLAEVYPSLEAGLGRHLAQLERDRPATATAQR